MAALPHWFPLPLPSAREPGAWRRAASPLVWWALGALALLPGLALVPLFPQHALLAAAAATALAAIAALVLRTPAWGACALLVIVYGNASDVITDAFGFSWLLRLVIAGALGAWVIERLTMPNEAAPARWPLARPMAAYGAVLALASAGALDRAAAVAALVEFGKAALVFYLVANILSRPKYFRWGIEAVTLAGGLLALPVIYQGVTGSRNTFWGFGAITRGEIVPGEFGTRLGGAIGDPNFLAMVLVAALPLALVLALEARAPLWRRGFALAVAAMELGATVYTYSRAAMLGLALIAVMVLVKYRRRPAVWALALGTVLAAVALLPQGFRARVATLGEASLTGQQQQIGDSSFRIRRNAYISGVLMFLDHPLLGVGPGNYERNFLDYSALAGLSGESKVRDPHSLPIQIAAESGLAGLAAFGWILAAGFGEMGRARQRLRAAGAPHFADLIWALELAVATYMLLSLFLHGAYFRHFWILFGLGVLGACLSQTAAPRRERAAIARVGT